MLLTRTESSPRRLPAIMRRPIMRRSASALSVALTMSGMSGMSAVSGCADFGLDSSKGAMLEPGGGDFFEGVSLTQIEIGEFPDGLELLEVNDIWIARAPGDMSTLFFTDYEGGPVTEAHLDGLTEAHGDVQLHVVIDTTSYMGVELAAIAGPWGYFTRSNYETGETLFDEAPLEPAPSLQDDGETLARTVALRTMKTCPSGAPGCLLYGAPRDVMDAIDPREPTWGWDLYEKEVPSTHGVLFEHGGGLAAVDRSPGSEGTPPLLDPPLRFTRGRVEGGSDGDTDDGAVIERIELLHDGRAIAAVDVPSYDYGYADESTIESGVANLGDVLLVSAAMRRGTCRPFGSSLRRERTSRTG